MLPWENDCYTFLSHLHHLHILFKKPLVIHACNKFSMMDESHHNTVRCDNSNAEKKKKKSSISFSNAVVVNNFTEETSSKNSDKHQLEVLTELSILLLTQ